MNHHLRETQPELGNGLLAVDAGQTGIKLRPHTGAEPGTGSREILLPGVQTHKEILPQLAAAISHAQREAGTPFATIAIGSTGLTREEYDAAKLSAMLEAPRGQRVLLAHDSVTSYLGAFADGPGAVVAAGTGVVTLAVGEKSVARVDGWGNIMGDAGSAYWIGQQVLNCVMRAHDGRGPATALAEPVREQWPDLEEAYISLQSSAARVALVASFARSASELAATDQVAAGICQRAAGELAHSVATALDRVRGKDTGTVQPVACLGGVFGSEPIMSEFSVRLAQLAPSAVLRPAAGSGLDGAAHLASLAAQHPLQSMVSQTVTATDESVQIQC
ncbi:N-acetylglucosamine kinase [Glutamicibacter nicotianae]|uniref:ATPase BadF/BadG/BcrA/BcrD type domain-containing protein n=1 Tax=Glutamicibacter nicotianae TaxID=37929 RepID=A0ABQ0RKK8_GLUNI|nr:BadF/BadG/BcrA/BcrD ATPase family protein [Glutamicibacter nicotianae]GEC12351.1 hypothetical protein ANI01nite_15540 [Glutamicibacter nicotianae]